MASLFLCTFGYQAHLLEMRAFLLVSRYFDRMKLYPDRPSDRWS